MDESERRGRKGLLFREFIWICDFHFKFNDNVNQNISVFSMCFSVFIHWIYETEKVSKTLIFMTVLRKMTDFMKISKYVRNFQ